MFYLTAGILAAIAAFFIVTYNSLITLKNKSEEAWSDIDTQLKRRYDLIPNLVETVKGYASHESETLEKVIQARSAAMSAQSVPEKEAAENMLSKTLKSIFALSESYPELKANANFQHLQETLTDIEEHIQLSRRYYNATVRDYNTKQEVFPSNFVAKFGKFEKRAFFEAEEEAKQNVKVSFSENAAPAAPTPTTPGVPPVEAPQATEPGEESGDKAAKE